MLDGNERSSLSYGRAIAAIKSYPWIIDQKTSLRDIKGIGEGVETKIAEWLEKGFMIDAKRYKESEKLKELGKLAEVYGLGSGNARKMHDSGVTTLDDLPKDYNIQYVEDISQKLAFCYLSITALNDLFCRIPRIEVEEIAEVVAEHIEKVRPGAEYCIGGGYYIEVFLFISITDERQLDIVEASWLAMIST